MTRAFFLPAARRDLDAIWSYVAEHDVDAADRLIGRITQASELLARRPFAGADAGAVRPGLRKWTVKPYIMLYVAAAGQVRIVRIVHGARDRREIGTP